MRKGRRETHESENKIDRLDEIRQRLKLPKSNPALTTKVPLLAATTIVPLTITTMRLVLLAASLDDHMPDIRQHTPRNMCNHHLRLILLPLMSTVLSPLIPFTTTATLPTLITTILAITTLVAVIPRTLFEPPNPNKDGRNNHIQRNQPPYPRKRSLINPTPRTMAYSQEYSMRTLLRIPISTPSITQKRGAVGVVVMVPSTTGNNDAPVGPVLHAVNVGARIGLRAVGMVGGRVPVASGVVVGAVVRAAHIALCYRMDPVIRRCCGSGRDGARKLI